MVEHRSAGRRCLLTPPTIRVLEEEADEDRPLDSARLIVLACACGTVAMGDEPSQRTATRNVILVTADGLRWQEMFRGAELALFNKPDGGVEDVSALRREFWRDDTAGRRETLLPFVWTTIARQGQIFGNRDKMSPASGSRTA